MWADDKGITRYGSAVGQAEKCVEEANELLEAVKLWDKFEAGSTAKYGAKTKAIDGIGDTLVTLVMVAAKLDVDVVQCFAEAYGEIKGRSGRMGSDGKFHKE
jgi:NTP pyrophosphatase (non-canonical NTP hydrolase)